MNEVEFQLIDCKRRDVNKLGCAKIRMIQPISARSTGWATPPSYFCLLVTRKEKRAYKLRTYDVVRFVKAPSWVSPGGRLDFAVHVIWSYLIALTKFQTWPKTKENSVGLISCTLPEVLRINGIFFNRFGHAPVGRLCYLPVHRG